MRKQHDIRVSSAILAADLTPGHKMVYVAIRSRQGSNEWSKASQRQIAEDVNINKSTANRAIAHLIEQGWVVQSENGRRLKCLSEPLGSEYTPAKSVRKKRTKSKRERTQNAYKEGELSTQNAYKHNNGVRKKSTDKYAKSQHQVRKKSPRTENQQENQQEKANTSSGDSPGRDVTLSHPAVGIYKSVMHLTANDEQRILIASVIDPKSAPHLKAWKTELKRTKRNGWRKTNIPRILRQTNERLTSEGHATLDLSELDELEPAGDNKRDPAADFEHNRRLAERALGPG